MKSVVDRTKKCAALLVLLVGLSTPSVALALELVLVHADWCAVCERWEDEVGVAYPKTDEAKIAPLRRIDYDGDGLNGLKLKKRVDTTPTFLLLQGDVEIARIEGYTADHFFWGEIAELLKNASPKPDE